LDNNTAERALRGPVVGRKNYYGAGSLASARLAAQAWTITATAQLAGANPLAYLTAYLQACADTGGHPPTGQALQRFLPWHASPADLAAWHNGDTPAPNHHHRHNRILTPRGLPPKTPKSVATAAFTRQSATYKAKHHHPRGKAGQPTRQRGRAGPGAGPPPTRQRTLPAGGYG